MPIEITTKRPQPTRCYVKVIDPKTGKSTTQTVYGVTAKAFLKNLPKLAESLATPASSAA